MVELQVEDVQAALDVLTVDGVFLREMTRHNAYDFAAAVADLVAVAREWLASQATTEGRYVEPAGSSEQTPDYEAAAIALYKIRYNSVGWRDEAERQVMIGLTRQAKAAVDAALGVHPQDEGDEK